MMHVLFEEDGAFKTGTILTGSDASLQIETASGKRSKIKSANVLLRYDDILPTDLLCRAEQAATEMDVAFLWECAAESEFAFGELANEYFGHPANTVEATALLLTLQAAPIYFHRKGKGRFRKAPSEILAAALAGLEKKRLQAEAIERMSASLQSSQLPPEFNPGIVQQLLYKPDKNRPEWKALEAACTASKKSSVELLFNCGAIASAYDFHAQRFLFEYFPQGTSFAPFDLPVWPQEIEKACVQAFSIDDDATTEIDDAFSVKPLSENAALSGWQIGIHIAAPGLSILPQTPLGEVARQRLSTVYMPGDKITMLPQAVVESCALVEGRRCPAVSLYLKVSNEFEVLSHESKIEEVEVAANLRLSKLETWLGREPVDESYASEPFYDELNVLRQFSEACEKRRGKASAKQGVYDYNFAVEGDLSSPDTCRVEISERQRGNPLDKLVSELMIMANSLWGGLLAEKGVAAIYRTQTQGKVRQTTAPLAHEGLGVAQYAWVSSPLRRYVDLINQWQLIALLQDNPPHFASRSDILFAAMRDFDLTYAAYADFQRQMERYWCLRWLEQEKIEAIEAVVIKENLCKLGPLPLLLRVPSLPEIPRGQRVRLRIEGMDLFTLDLACVYVETLHQADEQSVEDIDESAEAA